MSALRKAAIYAGDGPDLRKVCTDRGWELQAVYAPVALEGMLKDARRGRFEVVLVQELGQLPPGSAAQLQAAGIEVCALVAPASKAAIGRPKVDEEMEGKVKVALAAGTGMNKICKELGVGKATVQRIKKEMSDAG